jgi:site-specific DNA-methyltransferase (adenine-specific)
VWELLLGGEHADLVWTDPPYGVGYVGKTADRLQIPNDALEGRALQGLLAAAFDSALPHLRPGAAVYVAAPSGALFLDFAVVLAERNLWRQTLVWVKDQFVMGRSDYHYRHESIFYGWVPGGPHRAPPDRTQDTVWEIDRPRRSAEHPTMKPVALIARALENSTLPGQLVVDPFAGSGSTLIAAHGSGRAARLIELDPDYADVICRRFQGHTGVLPVRNGVPVDFTETRRAA